MWIWGETPRSTNTSRPPFGDHCGDAPSFTAIVGSDPPSMPIRQIAPAELIYATRLPSGEIEGAKICPGET
jgi:hypothetical protein